MEWDKIIPQITEAMDEVGIESVDQLIAAIRAVPGPAKDWKVLRAGDDKWTAPYRARTEAEILEMWANHYEARDEHCHLGNGGSIDVGVLPLDSDEEWSWYRITGLPNSVRIVYRPISADDAGELEGDDDDEVEDF